jgi:hypothetical protein
MVSDCRIGTASELIWYERPSTASSRGIATLVIFEPDAVTSTWMSPYRYWTSLPVARREALWPGADVGEVVEAGDDPEAGWDADPDVGSGEVVDVDPLPLGIAPDADLICRGECDV